MFVVKCDGLMFDEDVVMSFVVEYVVLYKKVCVVVFIDMVLKLLVGKILWKDLRGK